MCKLLSYFLMFFYLTVSSSNSSSLHAMEEESQQTIAQQLIEEMEKTDTDVCVIGFNVGRANCFLHINKTSKDMIIVDCGSYYSTKQVDFKSIAQVPNLRKKVNNVLRSFISNDYELKHVIISHEHLDHKNIWDDALSTAFPYANVIRTDQLKIAGQMIGGRVQFIDVSNRGSRINSNSLVCYIDGMVYMGDLDAGNLELSVLGNNQILGMVFPHHGSVTNNSREVRNQVMNYQLKTHKIPIKFIFISNNLENRTKFVASRESLAGEPSQSAKMTHITDTSELPRHVVVTNATDSTQQRALANIVLYNYTKGNVYRAVIHDNSYVVSQQLEEISIAYDGKQADDLEFN